MTTSRNRMMNKTSLLQRANSNLLMHFPTSKASFLNREEELDELMMMED